MSTGRIETGAEVLLEGRRYKVLRRLPNGKRQFEDVTTGELINLEEPQILSLIAEAKLAFPGSKLPVRVKAHTVFSDQEQDLINVRLAYVREVLTAANTPTKFEPEITRIWTKLKQPKQKPSFSSVYAWKRRYVASGQDGRSLLPDHGAKGNRTARFPTEVKEICRKAIEDVFLSPERGTLKAVLSRAAYRIREENHSRLEALKLSTPTYRLIRRLITQVPAYEKHVARYGRESARHQFRNSLGSTVTDAALERAEMDHTSLDLFVLDDHSKMPLGRPYLTVCIDDFTRCVLGLYIGFTPPSFKSVAACLKDCFSPKSELRKRYPEISSDWPAAGVMRQLVIDNGREFHSNSLEQLCQALNIELSYCPRATPWMKGKIERFIGTLNRQLHNVPGSTFSNIFERDDYDPEKQAVLGLSELQTILRKWIADVYHHEVHRTLKMTPYDAWTSTVSLEDVRFPAADTNIAAVLAHRVTRVVTHKGIEFEGLFYNSRELEVYRQQHGPTLRGADVRINEADMGYVWVQLPNLDDALRVPCTRAEYASGISLWFHRVLKQRLANRDTSAIADNLLKAKHEIAELIENSARGRKGTLGKRVGRLRESQASLESRPETRRALEHVLVAEAVPQPTRLSPFASFEEHELDDFTVEHNR